jgi:hypothetical protein
MRIIDPNKSTVGSSFEALEARCCAIELAIQRLNQNLMNLAMQLQFDAAVNLAFARKLGIDLQGVADEVAKAEAASREKAAESVKIES